MNGMLVRRTFSLVCSATVAPTAAASPQAAVVQATNELAQAATNARLANEAFVRSDRLMMDWLSLADPRTGLLPRLAEGKDRDIWPPARQLLILEAGFRRDAHRHRVDHDRPFGVDILLTEAALMSRIGRLPDSYSFSKQGFAER